MPKCKGEKKKKRKKLDFEKKNEKKNKKIELKHFISFGYHRSHKFISMPC